MPERPVPPHDHTGFSRGGRLKSASVVGLVNTTSSTGGSGSGDVTDHGALTGLADDDHVAYATVISGGGETVSTVAATGSTETVDLANGNVHDLTLTADCTLSLTGAAAGVACSITLLLRQDGTGGWDVTWPGSVEWPGGTTPALSATPGDVDTFALFTLDGGAVWFGFHANGAVASFGTPALVLGTAAASGAASTAVRTDATIVAFDATVPVTQAYSDAAATGSVAIAARRDHKHGMPASGSGIGEILISDTPSTPLIFADLIQNEAQDDLVYADP